jgi:Fic family protein
MVKVYQEHAVFMFNELPKKSSVADRVIGQFFDALPETFKRKDAIDLAEKQFDIKERTADLYLAKLTKAKYLEKAKNGVYQKVQKQ